MYSDLCEGETEGDRDYVGIGAATEAQGEDGRRPGGPCSMPSTDWLKADHTSGFGQHAAPGMQ